MDAIHASEKTGGGSPTLRALPSITILAEATESEAEALEDWARGLDWVHWLFSSVRQRLQHLHFSPVSDADPRPLGTVKEGSATSVFRTHPSPLLAAWKEFAQGPLRATLGPLLIRAWQAGQAGDADALIALDGELHAALPQHAQERSLKAGAQLLRSTHRARYQGVLHHYRQRHSEGSAPGHFLIVWAAVGHFFQLSLANVIAEYLRLEWTMAARAFCTAAEPSKGPLSIPILTSQLMLESAPGLKLMGALDEDRDEDTGT